MALSPWTDLALTGTSLALNVTVDPMVDVAHVWHLFVPLLPEAHRAIEDIGTFVCGTTQS